MKSRLSYAACLLLAVLMSCGGVPDGDPSTAWQLDMEQGETVEVNEDFDVFVSSINDSRCPRGTECPTEGSAGATIIIRTTDADYQYEINNVDQIEVSNGPYKVTYILVRPFPDSSVPGPVTKFVRFQIDLL